jgi:hypothetical protein
LPGFSSFLSFFSCSFLSSAESFLLSFNKTYLASFLALFAYSFTFLSKDSFVSLVPSEIDFELLIFFYYSFPLSFFSSFTTFSLGFSILL